jgi:PAS domain S-box-containing protein
MDNHDIATRLLKVVEFTSDGIYVTDQEGYTLFVNSAYEKLSGYHRNELIGRHMHDLEREGYIDKSVSLMVLKHKKQISIIQTIGKKTTEPKEVIVTGNPVFNENNQIDMVVTSVQDITRLNKLQRELSKAERFSRMNNYRYSVNTFEDIIFASQTMHNIIERVRLVAPYPTSVLITGPSGVGKELIANMIHKNSDRQKQPFIKVNCSAIPEQLLESELFGYEPGSFTGALKNGKAGLLELADKGTILLDEVGEMSPQLQVKLLRALQEKQIRRIGSTKPTNIDIRIVAATNRNLKRQIEYGQFREDLYYRLAVVEISVPPLNGRIEDIEILIHHYLRYFCRKYRAEKHLSKDCIATLKHYAWPGNVRELKNVIENIVVAIPCDYVETYHLPTTIQTHYSSHEAMTLKSAVQQYERKLIGEALQTTASIRQAARKLGIDHSTLLKKLKNLGIEK